MCLRLVFLLITRLAAGLRLSWREETSKTAEILILRHQLAVLQRRQPRRPKLNWADRALLAALLGVIPKARRHGLRLLVPPDTIVRWHRDIIRRGRAGAVHSRQDRPAVHPPDRQGPGPPAGPGEPRMGLPPDPRGAGRPGSQRRGVDRMGDPQDPRHRPRAATDRAGLVAVPAFSGRGDPGAAFFTADLPGGTQAHVLAVIEHATRRIRILGVTLYPTGEWTAQQARNLLMDLGGQADRMKFMIRDRGSNFTGIFDAVLAGAGIRTVLCNVRTPRHERDRRTLDRGMPSRAPGPHPRVEPAPSAADPARVREPPQPASAAPLPERRRAAEDRCPNRSILSSTASEDTLAPVAWSTNIAWSHDLDEVFGTHKLKNLPWRGIPTGCT